MAGPRDIALVLVTGAGASTAFGSNRKPLPLMAQWSDLIVKKLFDSAIDTLDLSGLKPGMSGPDFEAALGRFLTRAEAFEQIRDIIPLASKAPNVNGPQIQSWYEGVVKTFERITEVIHSSLMAEFHYNRLAVSDAKDAYGRLLQMAGLPQGQRLVYATTNYDALGELALTELGAHVDSGEPARLYGSSAIGLNVAGLLEGMGRSTPVLHLHGKAGWYRQKNGLVEVRDVVEHHPSNGIPVVMLPDPAKTYAGDDVLALLWAQFEEAVNNAGKVLVLGHSLHDDQLVRVLRAMPDRKKLAITFWGASESEMEAQLTWLRDTFTRDPSYFPVRFGPQLGPEWENLERWLSTGERPADGPAPHDQRLKT
jgi:hypothetical protein